MKNWLFFLFISYGLFFSSNILFSAAQLVRREYPEQLNPKYQRYAPAVVKPKHKIVGSLPDHQVHHLRMIHQNTFAQIVTGRERGIVPNRLCGYSAVYAAGIIHSCLSVSATLSYEDIMHYLHVHKRANFFITNALAFMTKKYRIPLESAHMYALGARDISDLMTNFFHDAAKNIILLSDLHHMDARAFFSGITPPDLSGSLITEDLSIKPSRVGLFIGATGKRIDLSLRDVFCEKILWRFTQILRGERKCQIFIGTNWLRAKGYHWVAFAVRESSTKGKLEVLVVDGSNSDSMSDASLFDGYSSEKENPYNTLPYIVKHMRSAERIAAE